MGDEIPQYRRQGPALRELDANEQQDTAQDERTSQTDAEPEGQTMEFASYPAQSMGFGPTPGTSTFNMGHMASVLPDYRGSSYGAHSFQQGFALPPNTNPSQMYQYQQNPQFAGQTRGHYDPAFTQQYSEQLLHNQQTRSTQQNYTPSSGYQTNYPQGQQQHFAPQSYYQNQQQPASFQTSFTQPSQAYGGQNPSLNPYGQSFGNRSSSGQPVAQMRQGGAFFYGPAIQTGGDSFFSGSMPVGTSYMQSPGQSLTRHSSDSSLRPSVPRGPPRKPKQSGHALWVGNLPPGTYIADLKDHFSRDATKDIESVFLISKSNCAFVNYKSESACAAAMTRFHDSRFQGVRLVCRLRRGSAATSTGTPTGPSSAPGSYDVGELRGPVTGEVSQQVAESEPLEDGITSEGPQPAATKAKEKFFVVKSLTVEDLEMSVRNGIWATQAHNETALNKAYETAENVYLIFSANKSGEYFGYARMASAIDDEAAANIEPPARAGPAAGPTDLPATIPTPATEYAPRGRIIDDSARGTIFWEADADPEDEELKTEESRAERAADSDDPEAHSPANPQSFGKPFKIVWVSTDRLPFYRTRGLRNPWNANREVKIARDGTELEPSVGRRLVTMFHRPQMAPSPVNTRGQGPQGGGYNVSMGYMAQPSSGRPY